MLNNFRKLLPEELRRDELDLEALIFTEQGGAAQLGGPSTLLGKEVVVPLLRSVLTRLGFDSYNK
jgi:hypothetical protein